jgi:hypothetical protein
MLGGRRGAPCSAAPSRPKSLSSGQAGNASFLCSFRWSILRSRVACSQFSCISPPATPVPAADSSRIGKDAHDMRPVFQFLVQPFEHVGRFHMLMMLKRVIGSRSASPQCCPQPNRTVWGTCPPIWPAIARCRAGRKTGAAPADNRQRLRTWEVSVFCASLWRSSRQHLSFIWRDGSLCSGHSVAN